MNLPNSADELMNGVVPQVGKPCLDFRIGKTSIDLLIEPINDLNGRILGDANSIPAAGLEAPHNISDVRDVR
jgi:hypothetical protein